MAITHASTKGQIIIPAVIRKKFHIKSGTQLDILDTEDAIVIFPHLKDPIKESRGIFKGEISLTEELLKERQKDKENE